MGLTKKQEADLDYQRYRDNMLSARRRRDFDDAAEWLEMMRLLRRYQTTRPEDRWPDFYSECHRKLAWAINSRQGPRLSRRDVAKRAGVSPAAVHSVLRKLWKEVSDQYVRQISEAIDELERQ